MNGHVKFFTDDWFDKQFKLSSNILDRNRNMSEHSYAFNGTMKEETLKRREHQRILREERLLDAKEQKERTKKAKEMAKLDANIASWKAKKLLESKQIESKKAKNKYRKKTGIEIMLSKAKAKKLKDKADVKRKKQINDAIEADRIEQKKLLFDKVKACNSVEDIEALMIAKQQGTEAYVIQENKKIFEPTYNYFKP